MATGARDEAEPAHDDAAACADGEAIDVYLMPYLWGYTPEVLRLKREVPYRFRIMSVDIAHGASINFGNGSRMTRLRGGSLVEQKITFTEAVEYPIYCTVYCGVAHDFMRGKIIVE